jgi:hypothetical protein
MGRHELHNLFCSQLNLLSFLSRLQSKIIFCVALVFLLFQHSPPWLNRFDPRLNENIAPSFVAQLGRYVYRFVVFSVLLFCHISFIVSLQEAYDKNMDKIQAKLKEAVQKGNLNSFDHVADMLDTTEETTIVEEDEERAQEEPKTVVKGENKVPMRRRKTVKRKLKGKQERVAKAETSADRPKPKYWCEF